MEELDFDFDWDADEMSGDDWDIGLGAMMAEEIESGTERNFAVDLPNFARKIRRDAKHKMAIKHRQENCKEILPELPMPGEEIHILGCNKFDAFDWIPRTIDLMGGVADELYLNTWIISTHHTRELVSLIQSGKTGPATIMTGLLYKGKEPAGYALLVEELAKHGGRYLAVKSHAKVTLIKNELQNRWITIETSANCSLNEKVEQATIFNARDLYQWYRDWFEEVFQRSLEKMELW